MMSLHCESLTRSDDGVRGEAAEDDGVDGSDACAGEQRDGELRAHAHVDGDAVSLADAELRGARLLKR